MLSDTQQNQQFDQLLDTFVACRSAVRYNSTLCEEQKRALIADIDQAVRFLRSYLVARAPLDDYTGVSPYPQSSPAVAQQAEQTPREQEKEIEGKLQTLYRFYHTYLNMQQNNNIEAFITRFNDVMVAINEVQSALECSQRSQTVAANPLGQVTSFIVDLYYVFVEFIRALSDALEDNDVHIDTEKLELSGLQGHFAGYTGVSRWPQFLVPLIRTYEMHQRLNAKLGRLTHRISDTTAFLEFLEESLNTDQEKREAIITQLDSASRLLKDLSLLLVDYEIATAIVLRSRRGS